MKGPEGCPHAAWDINIQEGCRFSWQKIESLEHFLLDNATLNFYFIPAVTLRIHGETSNNSPLFCHGAIYSSHSYGTQRQLSGDTQ